VAAEELRFGVADPTTAPAADLLAAMEAELAELYGVPGGRWPRGVDRSELAAPDGAYLVGWVAGEPVAGGGLRRIEPGVAEIKRMYVVPGRRRQGIAALLLAALEDRARHMGFDVVRLDTGPKQSHAERLYLRSGYRPVPDYNGNTKASFWGEKELPQTR
jgi:GNAT superfamily N-acetyltransferase